MEYRVLEPDVPGGLGENTVIDHSTTPSTVLELHYEFEYWWGDDLITSSPCYLVTDKLKNSLVAFGGTGYSFKNVHVTKSENCAVVQPELILPTFHWMTIHGVAGQDDVGLATKDRLVVNEPVLELLKQHNIEKCLIRRMPYRAKS